ncbi:ComEC/Rec2 family competence protein [Aerococcaceae bacterium NML210727]|nr:ComEC/Rec2 family competence protein [Aerococcaceae bacterium NML210727]MCW6655431.1 ComEC/Rec2 family competence protein [Aerococcaceae bacterium NML201296]
MKALQYHWTFIFLWLLALSWLILTPHIGCVLFASLLLLRIVYLRQRAILWGIFLGTVLLIGRFCLVNQEQLSNRTYSFEQNHTMYHVRIDPLEIRETEFMWIGRGDLQLEGKSLQVEWRLPREAMAELPTATQVWQVNGKMSRPEPARNFYVFDYAHYLAMQGIDWQLEIEEIQSQIVTSDVLANIRIALLQPFLRLRSVDWIGLHNKLLWNLDSLAYREYRPELVTLGVAHFFAISGFHVHYIRRLLDDALRRSGMTIETSRWVLFALLAVYSWLVRFPIGVVRVLVTLYMAKIARHYQVPLSKLDVLALTGIALLVWQPQLSVALGFLLSFLMTYLIHFYQQTTPAKPKWRNHLELTATCLLFSWPLIMQQSHEWNGWQLLYVLFFALVFERWLFPLFVVTSVSLWLLPSDVFSMISNIFEQMWQVILIMTEYGKSITVGHLSWTTFVGLMIVAGCWLHWIHRHPKRAFGIVVFGYGMLIVVLPYLNPVARLTVIDVGQGDALLYQPAFSQESWLFDTGGRPDFTQKDAAPDPKYAKRTIIPALKALGVRQLTGIVITHPDMDHIGNLTQLAQSIPIDTLIITPYTHRSDIWQKMLPFLSADTQIVKMPFTSRVQHPSLPIQLFTVPDLSTQPEMDGSNDTSIVALITFGDITLLNMGDLSSNAEAVLLQHYPELQADILKTGHHGSKHSTSTQFLEHIQPKLALISAGYQNRYGHPHLEVIERLQQQGIPYLATNERGAIQLSDDWIRGLQIQTVLSEEEPY